MKKIALLIYPECSIQEISSVTFLFKWEYNTEVVTFSQSLDPIKSEEGFQMLPHKTLDEFQVNDYICLVLPGMSDMRYLLKNKNYIHFLTQFKQHPNFVIGAICGAPALLSMAGLLDDKKFTNSLFHETNDEFPFINTDYLVDEAVVVDQNIVTACGFAYNEFAVALAKRLGYNCPDKILQGVSKPSYTYDELHPSLKKLSDEDYNEFLELLAMYYENIA